MARELAGRALGMPYEKTGIAKKILHSGRCATASDSVQRDGTADDGTAAKPSIVVVHGRNGEAQSKVLQQPDRKNHI